jgi:hypothetical protein
LQQVGADKFRLSRFENAVCSNHAQRKGAIEMNADFELVGKTITGVVATPGEDNSPHRIWMLQFSDGSHVEFVSPSARKRLIRATGGHKRVMNPYSEQHGLGINVA